MKVHYKIVEHDGGWAYKQGDVFSEPFPSQSAASDAARKAAQEQRTPGAPVEIEYQDETGEWRVEHNEGNDRPETDVT